MRFGTELPYRGGNSLVPADPFERVFPGMQNVQCGWGSRHRPTTFSGMGFHVPLVQVRLLQETDAAATRCLYKSTH